MEIENKITELIAEQNYFKKVGTFWICRTCGKRFNERRIAGFHGALNETMQAHREEHIKVSSAKNYRQ
jgi:hypothetical protein